MSDRFLCSAPATASSRLRGYVAAQPTGLVHGDAIQANLLRRVDGKVLMCDFNGNCRGQQLVDLVPTSVNEIRFNRPGGHAQLVAGYGYDITTDAAWPLLREARELKMVVGAFRRLASEPRAATEFQCRLASIRTGGASACWDSVRAARSRIGKEHSHNSAQSDQPAASMPALALVMTLCTFMCTMLSGVVHMKV